ncbi:beta-2-glycoprotein 1-like [Scyliorhinus torazame]|uniref:beta-2-glycoprotein 1-like n=1 Tax=Scyliorhinus torazame TaxID=75743 RepID=UPI003B5BE0A2
MQCALLLLLTVLLVPLVDLRQCHPGRPACLDIPCPPRSSDSAVRKDLSCSKSCVDDRDCLRRQCLCDGACGLSCISANRSCPWPVSVDNARVTLLAGSRPTFGQWLQATCLPGFRIAGGLAMSTHRCQGDRNWSRPMPFCLVNRTIGGPCVRPPELIEGFYETVVTGPWHTVRYSCNPGFRLDGTEDNSCRDNGTWARGAPICRPIYCDPPSEIENGLLVAVEKGRYRVGEMIYYLCRKGFVTEGSNEVTCTVQGSWTAAPVCQAPCRVDVYRSRVLYDGAKVWLEALPGGRVKHLEELSFYCLAEDRLCSNRHKTQCVNGRLPIPECYREPTWVRYTLFPWKVISELDECKEGHP